MRDIIARRGKITATDRGPQKPVGPSGHLSAQHVRHVLVSDAPAEAIAQQFKVPTIKIAEIRSGEKWVDVAVAVYRTNRDLKPSPVWLAKWGYTLNGPRPLRAAERTKQKP